jgi:hypothetical protein
LRLFVLAPDERQVDVLAAVRWESLFKTLVRLTEEVRLITAEKDKISDALTKATVAVFAATILATPWYGFTPVIAACTGLVVACVAFNAVTEGFGS